MYKSILFNKVWTDKHTHKILRPFLKTILMEKRNPMKRDNARIIFKLENNKYKVVTEQRNKFIVEEDECSCGHTYDYQPSMSTSFQQSYKERRKNACQHRVAVLNSEKLGPCDECGCYQVREKEMNHQGRHVMSRYVCTNCSETIELK